MTKIIDLNSQVKYDSINKEYDVEELLRDMEENNIEYRVVTALIGEGISEQNDFVVNLVKKHPNLIGAAIINPKEPNAVEETKRLLAKSEIKFIQFNSLLHGYRPEKMEYVLNQIFDLLSQSDKLIKVFTGHGFLTVPDQWAFYANQYPNITFVIENMGGTDFSYGTIDLVKEVKNMILCTSYETELPALRRAFDELPKEILLYGSNYPLDFTDLSILKYNEVDMDKDTKNHLFYENAKKLLNI